MVVFSRNPHKHWVKPRLLKNKVAKSGYTTSQYRALVGFYLTIATSWTAKYYITFPRQFHGFVAQSENENSLRKILIQCLSFWVGVESWSWRVELELVNVANVKISSSNVASFQLGIGIGIGNISTMATFTSVWVGELELEIWVGVGEWNWRFENLVRNILAVISEVV